MALTLKVSAGGPPVGAYKAKFIGVEPTTHEKYGAGLKWKFEVVGGAQAGVSATRVTSPSPTLKNGCGKLIAGLLGRSLAMGEEVGAAIEACVGRLYMIAVEEATNGGATRVGSVFAAPADN